AELVALRAQPEAKVERHLVVAAAAGVQLAAERPEELHEPPLDRHVDVLVRGEKAEAARVELAAHGAESPFEPRALAAREQPRSHERADVRHAARDVVRVETAVDGKRAGEALDGRRRRRRDPSGP